MRLLLTILTFVFIALPSIAFAQPGPTPDAGPTSPFEWYTSVAGVVAATAVLVQILKRMLANVPYANTLPVWAYSVFVSALLTYLCVNIFGTLPGPLGQAMMQAVIMAAAASGIYEWLRDGSKPLAQAAYSAGHDVEEKNRPTRMHARRSNT